MRIFAFIVLLIGSCLTSLPVFLFGALLYMLVWPGYELLIIGVLIDSVFGTESFSLVYTLSLGLMLVVLEVLRPYLSWYTDTV